MTEEAPQTESTEQLARSQIESDGVSSLVVNDLTLEDLNDIEWSGGPLHPESVRKALERKNNGEVDYLTVRAPNGKPITIGGVDYKARKGTGTMWQLATMESLRGLGLGTKLIESLEQKIKGKGLKVATLSVEKDNPLARALYERLGYDIFDHDQESWEELDENGQPYTYVAEVDLMRKELL